MLAKETHVIGPPGTGKTTHTAHQIKVAVDRGYKPEAILVMSFTKTGAAELVGRDLVIPKKNVATIHAHCYRLLGRPKLAEALSKVYNEDRAPQRKLSRQAIDDDLDNSLPGERMTEVDALYERAQLLRAKMVPRQLWPSDVLAWFEDDWEHFKQETESADFTDLLEHALEDTTGDEFEVPPDVAFVDEAQDNSRLEMALIRKWAQRMQHLVVVGDPDQSIFAFKGADPKAMVDTRAEQTERIILSQSWRVPRRVHALAREWIQTIKDREDAPYHARKEEGRVFYEPWTWRDPGYLVKRAQELVEDGDTVMILGTCSYQLQNTLKALRASSLPFHNPFRLKRGDWNPFAPRKGTSVADRLFALTRNVKDVHGYEAGFWRWSDLKAFMTPLGKTVFASGKKMKLLNLCDERLEQDAPPPTREEIRPFFRDEEEWGAALAGDLSWYERSLQGSQRTRFAFGLSVAQKFGIRALSETPRVTVGTIHSVKGGQADHVFIYPDLSRGAYEGMFSQEGRDHVIRTFYVGLTRAKETVTLTDKCEPWESDLRRMARQHT